MSMTNPISATKGFSLVEVLISLFILAVGILGIISLQLFAQQNNYDAIQRTTAAALASDIIERMRMNRTALADYISTEEPVVPPAVLPTTCNSEAAACTAAQAAAHDLAVWYSMIGGLTDVTKDGDNAGGLRNPSACIIQDPNAIGGAVGETEYRIVIAWRGRTAFTNSDRATCGNGATDAGGNAIYGANNVFRRIYVLDAKIE